MMKKIWYLLIGMFLLFALLALARTGNYFSSDMNIDGNLDVTGNITGLDVFVKTHCESYSNVTQIITNTAEYGLIHFPITIGCEGIETDTENFTLPDAGTYSVFVDLQADKTGGGVSVIEAVLFLDEEQVNGSARQRAVNSNNEVGYFAIATDVEITASSVLSVGITASTGDAQLDMACILCFQNVTAMVSIDRIS